MHTLHELVADAAWTLALQALSESLQAEARGLVTVVVPGGFH